MRLIDADAIEYTYTTVRGTEDGHNWRVFAVGEDEIDEMPTIDAVPVVRCRECRHNVQPPDKGFAQCELDALIREPEFWCRAGQRKDGADNG